MLRLDLLRASLAVSAALALTAGCSARSELVSPPEDAEDAAGAPPFGDAGTVTFDGGSTLDGGPMHLGGPCNAVVDAPVVLPRYHVAIGTDVAYDSNPPSSGPHYPIWAAYQTYTTPVDRRYYVHNLEHGTIVFAYNCALADGGMDTGQGEDGADADDAGPCADVVLAFTQAESTIPDDPVCAADDQGVRVRALVTPDPLLDVPVAAAAWGWTYRADCVDLPTLEAFALAHYRQGPEDLCDQGTNAF